MTFKSDDINFYFIQKQLLAIKVKNIINIIINIFNFMQNKIKRFKKVISI